MFFKPPPGPASWLFSTFFCSVATLRSCFWKYFAFKYWQISVSIYFAHFDIAEQTTDRLDLCFVILTHSLRMSMNIFVSLAWWWELSSCQCHLWQGITAVTKWTVRRIDCSDCSCSLGRPPPLVSTDIWQCQGQGWNPWCWCQTWLMAQSLDQPRCEECRGREGIAGRGLCTLVQLRGYYIKESRFLTLSKQIS